MRKVSLVLGIGIIVAVLVCGFIAYYVRTADSSGATYDGFGRSLIPYPSLVRVISMGKLDSWSGWGWRLVDIVIFGSGIGLGGTLINYGSSDKAKNEKRDPNL